MIVVMNATGNPRVMSIALSVEVHLAAFSRGVVDTGLKWEHCEMSKHCKAGEKHGLSRSCARQHS